jgi:hypothetical protein
LMSGRMFYFALPTLDIGSFLLLSLLLRLSLLPDLLFSFSLFSSLFCLDKFVLDLMFYYSDVGI